MDWVFWVIVAGIVAACAVAYVAVRFGRSNKQVTAAPEAKAVTPTTVEQEPAEQPGAPAAPATAQAAAEEAVSELETPEAPGARLARLRRRLAGSQNTLARALADLLSVDKIDDETWDDFESTLIASDLGVGPATELVENLRKALAVGEWPTRPPPARRCAANSSRSSART